MTIRQPEPRITPYTLPGPADLRFAFVSDLHDRDNEPVLAALEALRPDAVLVGGDFIHDFRRYHQGFAFLRGCAALFPTFVSVGNHDLLFSGDLRSAVEDAGAVFLDNQWQRFRGICIGGLSSGGKEHSHLHHSGKRQGPDRQFLQDFSAQTGYKLLLCHHPEYFDRYIRSLPIDLTLSGHAHGGQWRFCGQGVFAPGQGLFPRYTSGLYHKGRLLVGRGLGNAAPVPRINNQPEILDICLTIR